jgi:hypothetical protein
LLSVTNSLNFCTPHGLHLQTSRGLVHFSQECATVSPFFLLKFSTFSAVRAASGVATRSLLRSADEDDKREHKRKLERRDETVGQLVVCLLYFRALSKSICDTPSFSHIPSSLDGVAIKCAFCARRTWDRPGCSFVKIDAVLPGYPSQQSHRMLS